jgi:putative peptidoglycan lipid II flippase
MICQGQPPKVVFLRGHVITQSGPKSHQKNPQNEGAIHSLVARRAVLMALGTLTSRIFGLLRDMALAALFPKIVTDAFGVASRVPNLFRRLMGEGSLSASFLPVFTEVRLQDLGNETGKNGKSHQLLNHFATLLWIALFTITALGILKAEALTRLLVGYHFDVIPGKFELTVKMAKIMLGFLFLVSTSGLFSTVLQALGSFGWPAMTPAIFNIIIIGANFWPHWFGYSENLQLSGETLAWGVLIGGSLQVLILAALLMKKKYLPRISWPHWNANLKHAVMNMLPGMVGMGVLQGLGIINTRYAASMGQGSNTFLYLADRVLELPLSLISVSLGAAMLPSLSEHWSKGEAHKLKSTAASALGLNLFVAIPAAAGLLAFSRPIVSLLFGHGEFHGSDIAITAQILQISAATLLVSSLSRIITPIFYAMKNTWLPALSTVIAISLHLLMASWWLKNFGLAGLVGSTATCLLLQVLFLAFVLQERGDFFPWQKLFTSFFRFGLTSLPIFLVGWWLNSEWDSFGKIPQLVALLSSIVFAAGIYFALARLQKISELNLLLSLKKKA